VDDGPLDAGDFGSWRKQIAAALAGEQGSDVPCASCTACCTSSQFVHIAPEETDALTHIPGELLFAAPGLPHGHVLMGYDERGHCPMLHDGACSIYAHRPRTCRTYDCRVFPAAGLVPTEPDKARVARQVERWRFRFANAGDRVRRDAVRAAADFVTNHPELLPSGAGVSTQTQLAVLAVELGDVFVGRDDAGRPARVDPSEAEVQVAINDVIRRSSR